MTKKLYLAGPITSLTYAGAVDWREDVSFKLRQWGYSVMSPMRDCRYLSGEVSIPAEQIQHEAGVMSTSKGILLRDRTDCITSDAIIVYFPRGSPPSVGTAMEVAWGHLKHIPVIGVSEDPKNINRVHPMLSECVLWCANLSEAVKFTVSILGGN